MADTNIVTIVGNIAADPEMRFLDNGTAITRMRVALNDGWYDREKGEWQERETVWMRIVMWRDLAANVAASLRRGDRVVVVGKLRQHTYEVAENDKRTITEVEAQTVGLDLSRSMAAVMKVRRDAPAATDGSASPADDDSEPIDISHLQVVEDADAQAEESELARS